MKNKVLADFTFKGMNEFTATVPKGKTWEIHLIQINSLSNSAKSIIDIQMNNIYKVKDREVEEKINIDFSYRYILEEGQTIKIHSNTNSGILNTDIIGIEYSN